MKAGGLKYFIGRDSKKKTHDMELYWLDATALGVCVWNVFGASTRAWIAATLGHRFPMTSTG